jgi:hypothetical protein
MPADEKELPLANTDASRKKPVWYLAGPFDQYSENVKKLASERGLRIIDATATDDRSNAADEKSLPRVTLKRDAEAEAIRQAAALTGGKR